MSLPEFLDSRFDKLRLMTVGKQYVPRMMLHDYCKALGVSNEELSAATGGRFSAEFFRSLGDSDDAQPGERETRAMAEARLLPVRGPSAYSVGGKACTDAAGKGPSSGTDPASL